MLIRARRLASLLVVGCVGVAVASCSSNSSGSDDSGGSLVGTCDKICSEVSECVTSTVLTQCQTTCNDLSVGEGTCLSTFASYLACFVGATSVSCENGGVHITLGNCQTEKQDFLSCNAGPGLVSACLELSGSTACTSSDHAQFCIGNPGGGCSATPNVLLGVGTYCCP